LYDVVLEAQDAAIAAVKPGAKLRSDVHQAARRVIAEAGYGAYFGHSTSHYVGLLVHDVGDRDGTLEAGMVITVEPGIYLPDDATGIRIEDMLLVTKRGARVLTEDLPRSADEIEALMKSRKSSK
jgi:Xaa-Pro aminopeptidase